MKKKILRKFNKFFVSFITTKASKLNGSYKAILFLVDDTFFELCGIISLTIVYSSLILIEKLFFKNIVMLSAFPFLF